MSELANQVAEDDASSAERIDWLRQRGVKIEFPEGDPEAQKEAALNKGPMRTVQVVRIPQNSNRPYETLAVQVPEANGTSDPMTNALKPHFRCRAVHLYAASAPLYTRCVHPMYMR